MALQADTPKTQILLTVGTNELPVLVAACRLAKLYKEIDGVRPGFTFIHSAETGGSSKIEPERECKRIKERMEKELNSESALPIAEDFVYLVDPYWPDRILPKLREKLADLRRANPGLQKVCLAYTGGTKAMAVHSYEAVKGCGLASQAYYLHPRENRLMPNCGVADERADFAWSIEDLAGLHGFTTEFKYKEREIRPVQPSRELLALGQEMFEWFRKYQWKDLVDGDAEDLRQNDYNRWFKRWRRDWNGGDEKPQYRVSRGTAKPTKPPSLDWFSPDDAHGGQEWRQLTKEIAKQFPADKGGWPVSGKSCSLETVHFPEESLTGLCQFVKHQFLELKVYGELQALLRKVDYNRPANGYHDVHVAHAGTEDALFSLDVAAVIGYQLLAVSCTASTFEGSIRQAGFQVLHRARQIGGDHALAMVLCPISATEASTIEESLRNDIGVFRVPLAVRSVLDPRTPIQEQLKKCLTKARIPFKNGEGDA